MPQFLDISAVPDHACDEGLEAMYKAIGEGGDDGVWRPHESPFVRELIERFTSRGLLQIGGVQNELDAWIKGEHYRAGVDVPETFAGGAFRWTPDQVKLVRLYLESMPPERFTIDDWALLIDYLAQRYLPDSFARSAAEWMATKSVIMGKVQQAMPELSEAAAIRVMEAAPDTLAGAAALELKARQQAIMQFGASRCAENIVGLTDRMRHKLKATIIQHQEAVFLGDKVATAESLQTKLLDNFGELNRDWRRIALTEGAENSNQGYIASLEAGAVVKRLEKYANACSFCRSIDGKEFTVVDPGKPIKRPDKDIWVGKTNIGRSASPMRRVGGELIPREPHEMWWPAAGVMHPHCRGIWITIKQRDKAGDKKFSAWLDHLLKAPPHEE